MLLNLNHLSGKLIRLFKSLNSFAPLASFAVHSFFQVKSNRRLQAEFAFGAFNAASYLRLRRLLQRS